MQCQRKILKVSFRGSTHKLVDKNKIPGLINQRKASSMTPLPVVWARRSKERINSAR